MHEFPADADGRGSRPRREERRRRKENTFTLERFALGTRSPPRSALLGARSRERACTHSCRATKMLVVFRALFEGATRGEGTPSSHPKRPSVCEGPGVALSSLSRVGTWKAEPNLARARAVKPPLPTFLPLRRARASERASEERTPLLLACRLEIYGKMGEEH